MKTKKIFSQQKFLPIKDNKENILVIFDSYYVNDLQIVIYERKLRTCFSDAILTERINKEFPSQRFIYGIGFGMDLALTFSEADAIENVVSKWQSWYTHVSNYRFLLEK